MEKDGYIMANNSATILVTGAAGLIGSAVTDILLGRGFRVLALDNFSIGYRQREHPNIVWKDIDVANESVADILKEEYADAVIHCAAHPGGRSLMEPAENARVNILGSMRIFEWCCHAKVPIVYLSSSIVYGDQPQRPISEDAAISPGTIYGICKVACENFLKVLGDGYGLKYTILRLFATYGAGHRPGLHQGVVNVMLTQLTSGNRVEVKGSLNRVRDLIYVTDAARAIVDSLFDESSRGKILNIGTGTGKTILEIIELLCDALGRSKDEVEIIELAPVLGDPLYNVADIAQLKETIEFEPEYDIRAGLKQLVRERTITV